MQLRPPESLSTSSSNVPISPSTCSLDPFFHPNSQSQHTEQHPLPPSLPQAREGQQQQPLQLIRSGSDAYPIQWSSEGSAERSKEPLLKALTPIFEHLSSLSPSSSSSNPPSPISTPLILEIASGFGVHLNHFAQSFPLIDFLPTECDPHLVAELDRELSSLPNVKPAKVLDVLEDEDWEGLGESFDGVIIDNLLHVAPPSLTEAIFKHLASSSTKSSSPYLRPEGVLAIYGAFIDNGRYSSEGDRTFDEHIRSQSILFGLRDISDFVIPAGRKWGFELESRVPMPRGNWLLLFRRRKEGAQGKEEGGMAVDP